MGDDNQYCFIRDNLKYAKFPVLEVGSKIHGPNYRLLFPNCDYVGIDMEEGDGVDKVLDITQDLKDINKSLNNKKFGAIICMSVLEHCKDPFKAALNISQLLKEDGVLFLGVPFSWRIHGYPSDYWRFTPEGIRILFPNLSFKTSDGCLATSQVGNVKVIDNLMVRAELTISKILKYKNQKLKSQTGQVPLDLL